MPASGSSIFTDADGYQANLQDILDLLPLCPRNFHARLTWIELSTLNLLRAEEASSRLAYVKLPADRIFFVFPLDADSSLVCSGTELEFGGIMLHAPGEHLHQRTTSAARWGSISLTVTSLRALGRTIAGRDMPVPLRCQMLRPRRADNQRLLRLHAQAGRLAETSLSRLANAEVACALEQELSLAVMVCLTNGITVDLPSDRYDRSDRLRRLEHLLSGHPSQMLRTRDICRSLALSEARLRADCSKALGMGITQYQRLKRLQSVRSALLRTGSGHIDWEELLARYGFASMARFVAEYWDLYGEMPPVPPRAAVTSQT